MEISYPTIMKCNHSNDQCIMYAREPFCLSVARVQTIEVRGSVCGTNKANKDFPDMFGYNEEREAGEPL